MKKIFTQSINLNGKNIFVYSMINKPMMFELNVVVGRVVMGLNIWEVILDISKSHRIKDILYLCQELFVKNLA